MSGVYTWMSLVVVLGLWVAVSECQETRQGGEAVQDAPALLQVGDDYRDRSDYAQAIASYEQALAIHREVHDQREEGITLMRLGQAYSMLSHYERAIAFYEQALTIHRDVHNRQYEGITLTRVGFIYERLSHYERAIALYEQALTIHATSITGGRKGSH